MTYLLDTNIISEIRKRQRCDANVAAWWATVADTDLYLSVLTLGEIRKGIELLRPRDPQQAAVLEKWFLAVRKTFGGRILFVDDAVADTWGRMNAPDPVSTIDGLAAATAKVNGLTLVTRNTSDIERTGVRWLNPFEPAVES